MVSVLEKMRKLEKYIAADTGTIDPVLELTLDKLLARELARATNQKETLTAQITEFEQRHNLSSEDFLAQFQAGTLGDDMDFIEWAATLDMLKNLNDRLTFLKSNREK